jgi:hypothetical protein
VLYCEAVTLGRYEIVNKKYGLREGGEFFLGRNAGSSKMIRPWYPPQISVIFCPKALHSDLVKNLKGFELLLRSDLEPDRPGPLELLKQA